MTDPIANLIAAAEDYTEGPPPEHPGDRASWERLRSAIAAAKAAAEARPDTKPDDACDFYGQLPKGPTHGRFSASDRAELDSLKRKAFESARPEPAAEPSELDDALHEAAQYFGEDMRTDAILKALEALAREVRR